MKEARELLLTLKKHINGSSVIAATVTAVNKTNNTCSIIDSDDLEMQGVRLQSTINDNQKGCNYYPKVDSIVLVEKLGDKGEMFVIMMSEVEEVNLSIGATLFKQDLNGFQIKKGNDSLKEILSLIIEATTQIAVVIGNNPNYEKLTQAATKLNNLMN
jgi:hypothetical protein